MSAQKAEQIYDEKQALQSIRDHIMKLEIEQTMDETQGLPKNQDLESRISGARSKRDEKEAEIERLEGGYQDWLSEND